VAQSDKSLGVPLEAFSKVVEAIYDCTFDPSRWQETVGMIAELCRSHYAFLGIIDLENQRNPLFRRPSIAACRGRGNEGYGSR